MEGAEFQIADIGVDINGLRLSHDSALPLARDLWCKPAFSPRYGAKPAHLSNTTKCAFARHSGDFPRRRKSFNKEPDFGPQKERAST
jgi:hypothetical protein